MVLWVYLPQTRMLKDRKVVLQHINVDTHIGQIEEVYIERFAHHSVKISSAQMIDAATLLVEEVYHHQSAVDCQQVMVRQSLAGELMRTIKRVLPELFLDSESHQKSQTVTPNKGVLYDNDQS